jgi:hypothetical protein
VGVSWPCRRRTEGRVGLVPARPTLPYSRHSATPTPTRARCVPWPNTLRAVTFSFRMRTTSPTASSGSHVAPARWPRPCVRHAAVHWERWSWVLNKRGRSLCVFVLVFVSFVLSLSFTYCLSCCFSVSIGFPRSLCIVAERLDRRFWWNAHALSAFVAQPELHSFMLPVIQGFVVILVRPHTYIHMHTRASGPCLVCAHVGRPASGGSV